MNEWLEELRGAVILQLLPHHQLQVEVTRCDSTVYRRGTDLPTFGSYCTGRVFFLDCFEKASATEYEVIPMTGGARSAG